MALLPGISLLPHASYPYDIKIKPDGSEAWIVGAVGDGVKVVDTATGQITQSIDLTGVGEYAVDVLFNVDGSVAYVSSRDTEVLVVIDAATYTVQKSIDLGGTFDGGKMALDPCTGRIFMVDWYDKSLLVIDPETDVVTPTLIGTSLWDLQYDPVMGRLYVLDRGTDSVRVLNAQTLAQIANVPVGDDPWGIDLTADGGLLVVACEDSHNVYFIDTATLINNNTLLAPDADPRDVSIHPDDVRAFVPTGDIAGDDGVYEIDLLTETVTTLRTGHEARARRGVSSSRRAAAARRRSASKSAIAWARPASSGMRSSADG
jgi:YVTN family beta-propeller protein